MFLAIRNINYKIALKIVKRYKHAVIFKMDKAYLRHMCDGSGQFEIAFKFVNNEQKVDRQFNFNRRLSETVDAFVSRVAINIEKRINKKNKKKKTECQNIDNKVDVSLLQNNVELCKEKICGDIFQPGNDVVLKVQSKLYNIVINSPWINSLELPNTILAGFPVYPNKFESVFTDKAISTFHWFRSLDRTNWDLVGEGYIFKPRNEDIGYYLKLHCTPRDSRLEGPSTESISSGKVEAGPGECPFETRHNFTKEILSGNEFRVVTYNILADLYCDSDYTREVLFPYCPAYALNIDYRKQLIIKELLVNHENPLRYVSTKIHGDIIAFLISVSAEIRRFKWANKIIKIKNALSSNQYHKIYNFGAVLQVEGYNADIICLQEVDVKVFKNDLEPTLSHLGYENNLHTKGVEVAEGLAFFCRRDRFKILESLRLVFAEEIDKNPLFSDIWEKIARNTKLAERILKRSTTLQINVIESLENRELLVVANIHLYFHPDADHIRLLHAGFAIRYLEDFVKKLCTKIPDKRISLIFCGDFNSVPECGIFKLYTTGEVPKDFIDYQSNKEEAVEDVNLKQSFLLESACGIPMYTNYTAGFSECLDYIFYQKNNLHVSQIIPLPQYEELTQNTALPSIVFPSDHIALVADLKWL